MAPGKVTGQQLIDLASQQRPIEIGGLPKAVIGLTATLCVVSGLCMILRIFVRVWILRKERPWGWDDVLALLSFVSIILVLFSLGYLVLITVVAAHLLARVRFRHYRSTIRPGNAGCGAQ